MSPLLVLFVLVGQEPANTEVPFRTIGFGASGQVKDGGAIVMRSPQTFAEYRKRMGTTSVKEPKVDWKQEQVVAIHAAGIGYGSSSIQVVKVTKKTDGALQVDAALSRGDRPAIPSPGVLPVMRKEGIYTLIVVPPAQGEVTLRVVDQPAKVGDKSGKPDSR